jgi:hypothetical protein
VTLPIPFDGFGTLEVDLLCAEARVAVELDGGQQLADPIAYRRDAVLHAILRVLAQRRQTAAIAEPLRFVRRGGR